jgi:hypothetical protein
MREMKVATNEVVVLTNSTVVRALGGPELTVNEPKRPACAKCHMIPGSAEPMVSEGEHIYHTHCHIMIRRFRAKAREITKVMVANGVTDPVARKTIMRAAVEAAKHVHA